MFTVLNKSLRTKIPFISVFNQLDAQNLFHNKFHFMPLHVSSKCSHHQEVKIVLYSIWYHHTYRWQSRARDDHLQVWWYHRLCNAILTSWWWENVLETCRGMKWNLLWNKFCASSWLNTEINILRCTVSKTLKSHVHKFARTGYFAFDFSWT